MLQVYKTEIDLASEQKQIIHRTIGVCRFVYNFYLAQNKNTNSGLGKTERKTHMIKSGTVSMKAVRYYVSVLVEEPEPEKPVLHDFGIGIDLSIKDMEKPIKISTSLSVSENLKEV